MAEYRIVHYISDIVLQDRIPVAVLVKDDEERVHAFGLGIRACSDNDSDNAMIRMILTSLLYGPPTPWEPAISPQVVVTEPREIPPTPRIFQWVNDHVVTR